MEMNQSANSLTMILLTILLGTIGCSQPDMRDQRIVDLAKESMARQAAQNEYIARQSQAIIEESQKLAEASKELVSQDAKARQELIAAQENLTT
jgi:hypothetical protein